MALILITLILGQLLLMPLQVIFVSVLHFGILYKLLFIVT